MDLLHYIYRLLLKGELHLAPVPQDIHHVLDIGTGTGIWAIQFAEYEYSYKIHFKSHR
jgi:Methylase of polypeptide chain release factors